MKIVQLKQRFLGFDVFPKNGVLGLKRIEEWNGQQL